MIETELSASYDSRASFYGKARVRDYGHGHLRLFSYGTHVADIFSAGTDRAKALVLGTYSATTLRHIKEFLLQNGFEARSKAEIVERYSQDQELHPALTPYYDSHRFLTKVRVETAYYDENGDLTETWVRCGRVGKTTGDIPAYLIMARRNSVGSSDLVLPDTDTRKVRVLGVQHDNGSWQTLVGALISDKVGYHESPVRASD